MTIASSVKLQITFNVRCCNFAFEKIEAEVNACVWEYITGENTSTYSLLKAILLNYNITTYINQGHDVRYLHGDWK